MITEEQRKGVLDVDPAGPSTVLAQGPGCIDRDNEVVGGLQTDKPFHRAIFRRNGEPRGAAEGGAQGAGVRCDNGHDGTGRTSTRASSTSKNATGLSMAMAGAAATTLKKRRSEDGNYSRGCARGRAYEV